MPYLLLLIILLIASCSQSGRRTSPQQEADSPIKSTPPSTVARADSLSLTYEAENRTNIEKNVVKMEKLGGVYYIPVEVDGINMRFVFDTGASTVSISQVEAMYLYKQGTFTNDDIVGQTNFMDANGDISEGTTIILKTVKIGNRTLTNIEASVVHNLRAPLLFGQSALGKFGKISIDNKKGEISFE